MRRVVLSEGGGGGNENNLQTNRNNDLHSVKCFPNNIRALRIVVSLRNGKVLRTETITEEDLQYNRGSRFIQMKNQRVGR